MSIKATILADSVNSYSGQRITTFMVEYPRIIMAEFNTHKMVEKNHSSSRAIPIDSIISQLEEEYFMPEQWGINKSGMSAEEYYPLDSEEHKKCNKAWQKAMKNAIKSARELQALGVHKQWCNRLIEPFQYVRGICTATDYDNFFHLRRANDAQPEIKKLADAMYAAYEASTPVELIEYQWHIPFFEMVDTDNYKLHEKFHTAEEQEDNNLYNVKDALQISVSLCAQVSYRKSDATLEKAEAIDKRLWDSHHYSPYGHQAKVINPYYGLSQAGITHQTKNGYFCSGNLSGFASYRHIRGEQPHQQPDFCNQYHK